MKCTLNSKYTFKDSQTVENGEQIIRLFDGMVLRKSTTQIDHRGWLVETHDLRWSEISEPLVFNYIIGIRPKVSKGWIVHKTYTDRLFLIKGAVMWAFYDDRPESDTYQKTLTFCIGEHDRKLLVIPPYVWHVVKNIGEQDAIMMNSPTEPYNHKCPDKYRLPYPCDEIPFLFP